MKKSVSKFAVKALSLSLAFSLASAATGPVRADGDTISNTTVPLAAPSSTGLVKKIWGSMDLRKLKTARTQTEKNPTEKDIATGTKSPARIEATSAPISPAAASNKSEGTPAEIVPGEAETKSVATTPASTTTSSNADATATAPGGTETTAAEENGNCTKNTSISSVTTAGDASSPVSKTETQRSIKTTTESLSSETKETTPAISSEPKESITTTTGSTSQSNSAAANSNSGKPTFSVGSTGRITLASQVLALPPGSVLGRTPQLQSEETQVVDSDEAEEVQETIKYEDLPTDENKTKVKAGAKFPIVIASQLTSKTAKKGDSLQGRLKFDLKIGDRLIAKKGSVVNGHITYVLKSRTILRSMVSKERWYRNSGTLGLAFDEIVNERGEHLPLNAQPARASRIVKNKAEGRELGVNHLGQVTGPWGPQLRHKAIRIGLNFAMAPAGVFSFGAMPVALGCIGAINPNFAFSKPVGLNVRHRRLKGFAWGFLSGVPGSWLIEDTTVHGQEAVIKPGDEFYAEFVDEFTGEQATDAQLMPGASTKLRGQVLTDPKKDKKGAPKNAPTKK